MLWERGKAYSQDLRERVFAAWDAGLRVGEIAEQRKRDFWYTRWQHCWLECDAAIW